MMLHTENPKDATRKPRELLNESGKDAGGKKIIIIITHGNLSQSDILKTKDEKERPILFNITTKRIKCIGVRNKPT